MELEEKSEDHQNNDSLSWGEHERLYQTSWQSIQWLLRYASQD